MDHVGVTREINRESSTPPSRQVARWLREDIDAGVYAPGQRLPSIADLVQIYGIARDTAAKALRILVDEGLAETTQGMGTYVAEDIAP
jgi:DNA-binding GntR family transcriptional regulator